MCIHTLTHKHARSYESWIWQIFPTFIISSAFLSDHTLWLHETRSMGAYNQNIQASTSYLETVYI